MAKVFDQLTRDKASALLEAPELFTEVSAVQRDDLWEEGKGFVGPRILEGVDASVQTLVDKGVKDNFAGDNVIMEMVTRRTDAVLSKPPAWSVQVRRLLDLEEEPTEQEAQAIRDAEAVLLEWVEQKQVLETLRKVADNVSAHGRACLRLYVPPSRLQELRRSQTLEAALQHIFLVYSGPHEAGVVTDKKSMDQVGVFMAKEDRPLIWFDNLIQDPDTVELTYLVDGTQGSPVGTATHRKTRLRVLDRQGRNTEVDMDLGGNLTMMEAQERRRFVTRQMLENQRGLSTASTEMRVVNNDAGFPLRILFNALLPGEEIIDPATGKKRFVLDPNFRLTAGGLAAIQGVEVEDNIKNVRDIKTPSAHTMPAAPTDGYSNEMKLRRKMLLNMGKQGWVEISDDATASGESRIQALFDFLVNIRGLKTIMDRLGRFALWTAGAMAAHLSNQPGAWHALDVDFQCRVNIPHLPASLIDAKINLADVGALSLESLMTDTGIDDVEAEMDRVKESGHFALQQGQQRDMRLTTLRGVLPSAPIETLARLVGYSDAEIALLKKAEEEAEEKAAERAKNMPPVPPALPPGGDTDPASEEPPEPSTSTTNLPVAGGQ